MSKNISLKICPRCGSRNLQVEEEEGKDRLVVICEDCDEVFELHNKSFKEPRPPKMREKFKDDYDRKDHGFSKKNKFKNRSDKSW
ncbi:MAG: hypothetical protein PHU88_05890 [candidate division Zixibacteria bacterium]|nr:hypothetical protein [candidate division Zixibacteria bacterium]MDD5426711.1 hypothetical protein [candidate division Zixibacteria bacterium]